jgi:polar amino acid transport system permease protein
MTSAGPRFCAGGVHIPEDREGSEFNQEGQPVSLFERQDVSPWAKASLLMGIAGLSFLPVIGAVLAIVFAAKARKQILTTDFEGMGLAKAGRTLGVIGVVVPVLALLLFLMRDNVKKFIDEFFSWDIMKQSWSFLLRGLVVTLELAFVSEACILVLGLIIALFRISRIGVFRFLAALYIDIIRGMPLLLQIIIIYFGLTYLGLNLSRFVAGVVALTVCYAAYEAEIFRAGIESIHKGQMEAARSLGMTYLQSMRFVVLPQAVRRVIPPLSNEFIALLKDTALVSVIGLGEMMLRARELMGTKASVTPLMVAAFFYLMITIPLMRLVQYTEKRLSKGD